MRVFAISDLHTDYEGNAAWVASLPIDDFRNDVLIVAGDITDSPTLFAHTLEQLVRRFAKVVFVPGNHDLWVARHGKPADSLWKFAEVQRIALSCGACVGPWHRDGVTVIPLHGWYDGSFGTPDADLKACWADFHTCRWPKGLDYPKVALRFLALNEPNLYPRAGTVISCSHFVPRIDAMPAARTPRGQWLHPVLGSTVLEAQLRRLGSSIHVYGHSHINCRITLDGVTYVNNALGYPSEGAISARALACIYEA
ncbi:MAG: metallophosphoesterase [Hyphomicrobiales bacterium]|nr:MAG: metallophosphoesterase [Hyphomicrobiales bacterium]